MARSFHRKKPLQPNSELNVTALIDLGFALLIIFMISTPLIEKEQMLEMDLPTSDQNQSSDPQDSVDLLVTSEGYQIDNNKVGMVELESELKRYGEMSDPPVMAIRTNGDSPMQSFVTLIDLMKRYRLQKFNIVTRPEDE
ncbi:MAG: biopolymer transporter ExbD [Opitutales bacterium]|jgi:biopolymer transport protein ExbD/biopolymer transport protein TolR|nr:biopolymer transporter ExbD [Opitutales bacterium]MDG2254105.1 biopolymer transporter ExbD [Opitutaceae bacterium]MBT5167245.1 biopolymer transporter ExbD [Opitutales bacterium]MBT5816029.1 biopolymer transporter ExbD [Opitutales bacterium]MBT6379512.1 biopolymer transporter ExbD [Opitutales bacterium]